jgi:NTP pyrophosphatase (non-canonical NTP hydrolase)
MAKAFKELKLIKARFIEEIDELIAEYKENKASVDETNFDEELGQILMDVIEEVQERDWERSF